MENKAPSLARRYLVKLGANAIGLVFNFVNVSIVPRTLGPAAYGNFEFLLSFFQQIMGFVDTGTSTAFYNKLAQRNEDIGLIRAYGKFVAVVFLLLIIGLAVIWMYGGESTIWPKQEWKFILLAALLCYLTWIHDVFRKVVDAFGCTIQGEFILVLSKVVGVLAVVGLFLASWLSLATLFLKELIFYAAVIVLLGSILMQYWRRQLHARSYATSDQLVMAELWVYCSPLLIYAFASVITGLADRWLLQRYSGSAEQGFYALSFRIAGVSFVFTSAMTQLIMREYSIAHGLGKMEQMQRLFKRYVPMLFTLTAYFSAFISMQAETAVWILGGREFAAAGPAMMLMALYPIHQTYGQMNGALLFATGKTKLYRNIGVGAMFVGLILTWGLLAPNDQGGLGAGSMGLAVKMVLLQLVAVNVQLWFNLKSLRLRFRFYLLHQIGVIAGLLLMAWLSIAIVGAFGLSRLNSFIASGLVYTILVGYAIFKIPVVVGINRTEIDVLLKKLVSQIRARP